MRSFARWVGELIVGNGLALHLVLLRCALMACASAALMALGVHVLFTDEPLPYRSGRAWQGLVLLSVVLALRAVFEMWELDAAMSLATVGVFTLGGLAYLASQNVAASPEIATRMWGFGAASLVSLSVAVVRGIVTARREAQREHD